MPRVKIDYVVSFSSEDPDNQASNLLLWDVSKKKWLCRKGEASCSVVLQLAKAVEISSVQVGAHLAALVEVLVGRSETPNEPFQVLVPSCVFLTPREARAAPLADRVRSFDRRALAAPAAAQRWDRVRLVCSQPYNKHCQVLVTGRANNNPGFLLKYTKEYGISFIHIFEPEGPAFPCPPPAAAVPPRLLALDTFSSDEEEFRPGELFAKHRQSSGPTGADTGAQIRQATFQALRNNSDTATELHETKLSKNRPAAGLPRGDRRGRDKERGGPRGRDRDNLMYTEDDEKPHAKIDHIVQRHKDEKNKDEANTPKSKDKANGTCDTVDNTTSSQGGGQSDSGRNPAKGGQSDSGRNPAKGGQSDSGRNPAKGGQSDSGRNPAKGRQSDSGRNPAKGGQSDSGRNHAKRDVPLAGSHCGSHRDSQQFDGRRHTDGSRQGFQKNETTSSNDPSTSRETESKRGQRDRDENRRNNNRTETNNSKNESMKQLHSVGDESENVVGGGARAGPAGPRPLRGVVFALSGYEAQRRRALRDLAAALGARYAPAWGPACTHLICAFPNTPKLREARRAAGGARVPVCTGEWVEQCARRRRALPWRWFATERRHRLSPPPLSPPPPPGDTHSESDTDDEIEKVLRRQERTRGASPPRGGPSPGPPAGGSGSDDSDVAFVKDERMQGNITVSESDSEQTEVETDAEAPSPRGEGGLLPAVLAGRTFVLDEELARPFDARLLARYVRAYGGLVCELSQVEEETPELCYVLCGSRAAARGPRAARCPPAARRVRADWLWACHRARRLRAPRPYV